MSSESRPSLSLAQRREGMYQNVEARSAVLVNLWERAQSMPIPRSTDSDEQKGDERQLLLGVLDPILNAKPGLREKFNRAIEIKTVLDEDEEKSEGKSEEELDYDDFKERLLPLGQEFETIVSENPEIRFLLNVFSGIEGLLSKRNQLRSMQQKIGPIHSSGRITKDEANKLLNKKSIFIDHINWAQVGRFSVSFVVEPLVFRIKDATALGYSTGLINIIYGLNEEREKLLESIFGRNSNKQEQIAEVIAHEEFHSFADSFYLGESWSQLQWSYDSSLARLTRLKELGAPEPIIQTELGLLRIYIGNVEDASREEILAEFAQSSDRSYVPRTTFATYDGEKARFLEKVLKDQSQIFGDQKKAFDIDRLRQEIKSIYEQVDAIIPERRLEVDSLFVLFPPSKIRHIRRIVNRWIQAKDVIKDKIV